MTTTIRPMDRALSRLVEGNVRFVNGSRSMRPLASASRIRELAEKGQAPFACVLSCSDSRVPAEIVFDCGLGDLFVCRIAGNIATPWTIASIEYAALKLKAPLCLVMGHTSCGALDAALLYARPTGSKHLDRLVSCLRMPVVSAQRAHPGASRQKVLAAAAWQNVALQQKTLLKKSPALRRLRDSGTFSVVGAVYDLHTGEVRFKDSPGLLPGSPTAAGAAARSSGKCRRGALTRRL